jgi:H+/gluconate symporter-like permease
LKIEIIYDCVSFIIVVVIPFFVISGIYLAIFRFIRKHNARRSEILAMSTNKKRNKRKTAKNEKKLLLVFLAMIVVFILGSFMYFFWTLLLDLYEYHSIRFTGKTLDICVKSTMFFRFCSSLCNPVLLTFFKQDFYEAVKSLVGR